jgi:hypothetical protein
MAMSLSHCLGFTRKLMFVRFSMLAEKAKLNTHESHLSLSLEPSAHGLSNKHREIGLRPSLARDWHVLWFNLEEPIIRFPYDAAAESAAATCYFSPILWIRLVQHPMSSGLPSQDLKPLPKCVHDLGGFRKDSLSNCVHTT